MVGFMPELYPDELTYSWISRYHVRSGHYSYQQTAEHLLIKKVNVVSKKFINLYVDDFFDFIERSTTIDTLIENNTMFRAYFKFATIEKQENIKNIYSDRSATKATLSIGVENINKKMRFCPICAKEDRELHGETYWHRSHQFDKIIVCPTHKCYLIDSSESFKAKSSLNSIAELIIPYDNDVTYVKNKKQLEFAQYYNDVINTKQVRYDIELYDFLNAKLLSTKYMSNSGRLKHLEILYNDICDFCKEINIECPTKENFRKLFYDKSHNPIYVCAIGMFLGITPYELVNRKLSHKVLVEELEKKIICLRRSRLSYKKIAKQLDITENIVMKCCYKKS